MMSINYAKLHKLYLSGPTARALFDTVVDAGVPDRRTTVDQLIEGSAATRRQAITLLRDLEAAGCGEFKVGRKGHPSRLEWSEDPREIARRAIASEQVDVVAEPEPEPEPEPYAQDELDAESVGATQAMLELALELPDPPAPPARARKHKPAAAPIQRDHAGTDAIEHTYVLRPNHRVSVTLPADLTRREAEVLAEWVRNLSFER